MECTYANTVCYPGNRNFLTREEKIEMLEDYKEQLEKEAQGIGERLAELKNAK